MTVKTQGSINQSVDSKVNCSHETFEEVIALHPKKRHLLHGFYGNPTTIFALIFFARRNECNNFLSSHGSIYYCSIIVMTMDSIWHEKLQLCMMKADSLGLLDLSLAWKLSNPLWGQRDEREAAFYAQPFFCLLCCLLLYWRPRKKSNTSSQWNILRPFPAHDKWKNDQEVKTSLWWKYEGNHFINVEIAFYFCREFNTVSVLFYAFIFLKGNVAKTPFLHFFMRGKRAKQPIVQPRNLNGKYIYAQCNKKRLAFFNTGEW